MEYPTPNVKTKNQFIKSIDRRIKKVLRDVFDIYKKNKKSIILRVEEDIYRSSVLKHVIKKYYHFIECQSFKGLKVSTKTSEFIILDFMEYITRKDIGSFIKNLNSCINPLMNVNDEECYLYYLLEIKKYDSKKSFELLKNWEDPLKNTNYKYLLEMEDTIPTIRYNIIAFINKINLKDEIT